MCCPVQVPVPVFLPTTLQGAEQIIQTINELKNKVPSDPLEADMLSMAEVIAEDQKPGTLVWGLDVWIKNVRGQRWDEHNAVGKMLVSDIQKKKNTQGFIR